MVGRNDIKHALTHFDNVQYNFTQSALSQCPSAINMYVIFVSASHDLELLAGGILASRAGLILER